MNIFILDKDPIKNAQYYVKKHITKMPLETTQLISNAIRINFQEAQENIPSWLEENLYKPTHLNHPCSIWASKSSENFVMLANIGQAIFDEFEFRRGKKHGSYTRFKTMLHILSCEEIIHIIPSGKTKKPTKPPLCMPDQYKRKSVIKSYRLYYMGEKRHLADWESRPKPTWWK